jgi:hypothetical protein
MLPHAETLLRLLVAAVFGSLIGFERERLLWATGIRTHMLLRGGLPVYDRLGLRFCLGACMITLSRLSTSANDSHAR